MSYDVNLYRKDNNRELLTIDEVEKLKETFSFVIDEVNNGKVMGFSVKYLKDNPDWIKNENGFEFYFNDDHYSTYISYSAKEEMFQYFKRLIRDVALILDLTIQDTQVGEERIDANEYEKSEVKSKKVFNKTKTIAEDIGHLMSIIGIEKIGPSISRYFISYYLYSYDPVSKKKLVLSLPNGDFYSSKIEIGDSLIELLKKEVKMLTGSNQYTLENMEEADKVSDQEGKLITKYNLFLSIPYFDLKERKLPFDWRWMEFE